jgi:class 3 adenylate cyclase
LPADAIPETRFATLGADRIAYQVFGEGDVDLLYVSATGDPIELRWDWPAYAQFLRRLGSHARVITFDRRGSGSSDNPSGQSLAGWEHWADDARAVLDAAESAGAVLFGSADGGPVTLLFAASHPQRTRGLILANTFAFISDAAEAAGQFVQQAWGSRALVEFTMPDAARDPAFVRFWERSNRMSFTPRDVTLMVQQQQVDLRAVLPTVRAPTLVLHREHYSAISLDSGRELAANIAGARFAILPGRDGLLFTEPSAEALQLIADFLGGMRETTESDRALAAILFTDIVSSTARAAEIGDRAWRDLRESHDAIARSIVEQHRGQLVKSTGDGVLATFDGPGRAIRGALALRDALRTLGLETRAGLHAGEIEVLADDIAGIAVHIASRVQSAAEPGEILVSATVPMLVTGAGFEFDDRGEHELKGVPGTWHLYAVRP